uniref:Uncharacterized protein n=1 Tax=Romanomermis culicivorax TaxID=13658 RepID=A0A915HJ43_ROMCU
MVFILHVTHVDDQVRRKVLHELQGTLAKPKRSSRCRLIDPSDDTGSMNDRVTPFLWMMEKISLILWMQPYKDEGELWYSLYGDRRLLVGENFLMLKLHYTGDQNEEFRIKMRIRIGKEIRYLIVSLTPNGSYLELDYKEPKMHFTYEAPLTELAIIPVADGVIKGFMVGAGAVPTLANVGVSVAIPTTKMAQLESCGLAEASILRIFVNGDPMHGQEMKFPNGRIWPFSALTVEKGSHLLNITEFCTMTSNQFVRSFIQPFSINVEPFDVLFNEHFANDVTLHKFDVLDNGYLMGFMMALLTLMTNQTFEKASEPYRINDIWMGILDDNIGLKSVSHLMPQMLIIEDCLQMNGNNLRQYFTGVMSKKLSNF